MLYRAAAQVAEKNLLTQAATEWVSGDFNDDEVEIVAEGFEEDLK